MEKLINKISNIVEGVFEKYGYDREYGMVTESNRPDLCQFQCNGALAAAKKYKKSPVQIAGQIMEELKDNEVFESVSAAGPGFINMNIKDSFLSKYINDMYNDKKYGCSEAENPETIIVDYGGANVAKPLHVGHLRPAIIGESIKRICRFLGQNVIGDVHLGDWGLQIGMIISELKRRSPIFPTLMKTTRVSIQRKPPFQLMSLRKFTQVPANVPRVMKKPWRKRVMRQWSFKTAGQGILPFGSIY
jgi:arginyl-tRNA synthetase